MSGLFGRWRPGLVAVIALASILAAAAVGFGVWATVTGTSALFGRQTALAGVYSLVLAAVVAAAGMITWARRVRGTLPPLSDSLMPVPSPGQVVVGDIPQEPPGFRPRADLSAQLDRADQRASVVHVVTGMRGVGKTQLAAAYARAKLAAGWRLVAWVNAGDLGSLLGGLAAVAEALRLANGTSQGAKDPGRAVRHRLEIDGERCVVVFDDASDPDVLRPFLPAGGAARILITSSQQSVANLGTSVHVDVFTPEDALAFLVERTAQADSEEAGMVARELGYLPLALAQAAAVIAIQHLPYGTYLNRLRTLPVDEYLTRDEGQPYPLGVAEAIFMSLDAVRAVDQTGVCAAVMENMAVLSATGVRRRLLHDAGQAGVLANLAHHRVFWLVWGATRVSAARVDRALAQLAERSLLSFSHDGETVIAHPLILRVVRDGLIRQRRLRPVRRAVATVLDTRANALMLSHDRRAMRDIAEQVMALQENTSGCAGETDSDVRMLLHLRLQALYYLYDLGDSTPQAIVVGEALTEDCQRMLGMDHLDTLMSRRILATAYLKAGRATEAISLHEQALSACKRTLRPNHPETLASANSLAVAYREAGRLAEAIPLHEQTLDASERTLGPDHHDTLASRNGLASAYQEAGRIEEAIRLRERTLATFESMLGRDHQDTLTLRSNLANDYQDAGRATEAIPLQEQVLADRQRVLGPDHPDTLGSRNNLAEAYRLAGRATEAISLHEQVLADRQRVLGLDHPDTLDSRVNLAAAYQQAGRIAEAIPLHEDTLDACEQLLGPDHPATLTSWINLANSYREAGRAAEAIPLLERALDTCERLLGPDHPTTQTSRNGLAAAYQEAGRASPNTGRFTQD